VANTVLIQAVGKDSVTLDQPPNSTHFDVGQQIRKRPVDDGAKHDLPSAYPDALTHPHIPNSVWGYPPPYGYMLGYTPPYGHPHYPPPPPPVYGNGEHYHTSVHPSTQTHSPVSSPGTALRLKVPLDTFCVRYDISDADQAKLAELEYVPGDQAVLKLAREDWSAVKFSPLKWISFIDAHKRFLKDVRDGKWATF
jgi:hypothetical protein